VWQLDGGIQTPLYTTTPPHPKNTAQPKKTKAVLYIHQPLVAHRPHTGYVLTGTGHPHPLDLRPPTPPRNPPTLYGCGFVVCCASLAWVSWYGRLRWWCVPGLGVVGVAAWGWAGDPWPIRGQPLLVRVGAVAVACLRCAGRAGAALRCWFVSRASVGLWSWHQVSECVARIARGPSACTAVPANVCPSAGSLLGASRGLVFRRCQRGVRWA